jgi:hypothetical protein
LLFVLKKHNRKAHDIDLQARLEGILFSGWVSWVVGILMKVEMEVKAWSVAYKLHAFAGRESNYTHRSRR